MEIYHHRDMTEQIALILKAISQRRFPCAEKWSPLMPLLIASISRVLRCVCSKHTCKATADVGLQLPPAGRMEMAKDLCKVA